MAGKSSASLSWGGLDKALEGAAKGLMNKRKALLADIGEAMIASTMQRFQDEKDPEGKTWEPSGRAWERGLGHSARKATKNRKARRFKADTGRFGKTLTDKGRLRGSLNAAVTNESVMWGSSLVYSRIHNEGGKAGRGRSVTIPKRQYLGINDADMEEIAAIVKDHLEDVFKD